MDIVFALLLLFGGFALGSVTAERDPSVQTPASVAEVRSQEPPGLTTSDPLTCQWRQSRGHLPRSDATPFGSDGPTRDACWRVCGRLPG